MNREELKARAAKLYGEDWQSALARRVCVDARTMRRWKAGDRQIPDWLGAFLALLARYPDEK